jgi:hypothetical protein
VATVVLTPQLLVEAGIAPTYHVPAELTTTDTFSVVNAGRLFLHAKKSQAVDCVITFTTPVTFRGKAVADLAVTVPASTGDLFIGPFDRALYNASGSLSFTLSNIAGLSIAAMYLP